MLVAIAVLLIGAVAACFVDRLGAPTLLLFLGLGMLLGEDGPGGIHFDDATLVRDAGSVALALILLEGGLLADVPAIRKVIAPSVLLATVGVGITAGISSLAAHASLDVGWKTALLVGAVVSSTDAAAVFAAVRGVGLRRRVESVLELESGINDPFAAILVIGLVDWQTHDHYGIADAALLLVRELGLGARRRRAVRRARPSAAAPAAAALGRHRTRAGRRRRALGLRRRRVARRLGPAHGVPVGLCVGEARIPHAGVVRGFLQGGAWLAQIGLFVLLGLLVTPSRLPDEGLAPLVVAITLVLVARPLAVIACATPFRTALARADVPRARRACAAACRSCSRRSRSPPASRPASKVFDVVFYVVIVSVAAQGLTLRAAARRLGVVETRPVPRLADLDTRDPADARGRARRAAPRRPRDRVRARRSAR